MYFSNFFKHFFLQFLSPTPFLLVSILWSTFNYGEWYRKSFQLDFLLIYILACLKINSFLITSTKTSHLTTTVYRYSFDENKKERKRERKKKEFTRPSSQSLRACFIQKAHLLCPGIFRFFHFFLVSTDFRYLSNYRPSCWMVERSM